jgi:hypothetical protein
LIAGVLIIIYIDYNDSSLSIHSHSKSIDTTAYNLEHPRIPHYNPYLNPPLQGHLPFARGGEVREKKEGQ